MTNYCDMDEVAILADRIKYLRTKRGLTRKQLAVAAQVDQKTILNIERGDNCTWGSSVALKNAAKVANALRIPLWELIRPPKRVEISEENTRPCRTSISTRLWEFLTTPVAQTRSRRKIGRYASQEEIDSRRKAVIEFDYTDQK